MKLFNVMTSNCKIIVIFLIYKKKIGTTALNGASFEIKDSNFVAIMLFSEI